MAIIEEFYFILLEFIFVCLQSTMFYLTSLGLKFLMSLCQAYYVHAAAAKLLQSCPTLGNPIDGSPPGSPVPGILLGCHFLLQCIKVKSESEDAQSYRTLSDPMDRSPPGSSVHGIFQARVLEWGAIAFSNYVHSLWHKFTEINHRRLCLIFSTDFT